MQSRIECPICGSEEIKMKLDHLDFKGANIYICANPKCSHGWTDHTEVYESISSWPKTSKPRAKKYLELIIRKYPEAKSLLEIGSASDFYFLKKLHKKKKEKIKLFLNDSYDFSKKVPGFIEFIRKLDDIDFVDLVYMSHSFEHIKDVNKFLEEMKSRCGYLIMELPCPCNDYFKYVVDKTAPSCGWHYQFFNEKSFKLLMDKHKYQIINFELIENIVQKKQLWRSPFLIFAEIKVN